MAYTFHRIFCGTPGDLEPERDAFYDVMSEFNESEAMNHGILLVSVSIVPHVFNIPAYQGPINDNVRSSLHYIQVLGDTWGPPSRNFEKMFELARKCQDDPAMPMREAVLMWKPTPTDRPAEPAVLDARRAAAEGAFRGLEYSDIESFKRQLRGLLAEWLADLLRAAEAGGSSGNT